MLSTLSLVLKSLIFFIVSFIFSQVVLEYFSAITFNTLSTVLVSPTFSIIVLVMKSFIVLFFFRLSIKSMYMSSSVDLLFWRHFSISVLHLSNFCPDQPGGHLGFTSCVVGFAGAGFLSRVPLSAIARFMSVTCFFSSESHLKSFSKLLIVH